MRGRAASGLGLDNIEEGWGCFGGPQGLHEFGGDRPHEVAGNARCQRPLLAFDAVVVGNDEDAGVATLANAAERLATATQQRVEAIVNITDLLVLIELV